MRLLGGGAYPGTVFVQAVGEFCQKHPPIRLVGRNIRLVLLQAPAGDQLPESLKTSTDGVKLTEAQTEAAVT